MIRGLVLSVLRVWNYQGQGRKGVTSVDRGARAGVVLLD